MKIMRRESLGSEEFSASGVVLRRLGVIEGFLADGNIVWASD